MLKKGDGVTVRVIDVNPTEKRIGLSLRENVNRSFGVSNGVKPGDKAVGVVERVENYGAFVKLEGGQVALLPNREMGPTKVSIGDSIELLITIVDDNARIRVSRLAREAREEKELVAKYQGQSGSAKSLGTFADLFKKK